MSTVSSHIGGTIGSEAGRRANVTRPLTRSLDYTEEGLAMHATQPTCKHPDDCQRPAHRRGWCRAHYHRLLRHGDVGPVQIELRRPGADGFWARVLIRGNDQCWPFEGPIDADGYGIGVRLVPGGEQLLAHRAAFISTNGPIPDGLTIDHECHNRDATCKGGPPCLHRRCCNPRHLAAKTAPENWWASPQYNGNRTHCPQGHTYDEANTYRSPAGHRFCRECNREQARRYREKQAESARRARLAAVFLADALEGDL